MPQMHQTVKEERKTTLADGVVSEMYIVVTLIIGRKRKKKSDPLLVHLKIIYYVDVLHT